MNIYPVIVLGTVSSSKLGICNTCEEKALVHLSLLLLQMYDNIASLSLQAGDNGEMLATGMISAEGEVMAFRQAIAAEGRVEDWMTAVLQEMRRTNRLITKEAIFRYCEDKSRYCQYPRYVLHVIIM